MHSSTGGGGKTGGRGQPKYKVILHDAVRHPLITRQIISSPIHRFLNEIITFLELQTLIHR